MGINSFACNIVIDFIYSMGTCSWLIYGCAIYFSASNDCGTPESGSLANSMNSFMLANIIIFLFIPVGACLLICCILCCLGVCACLFAGGNGGVRGGMIVL